MSAYTPLYGPGDEQAIESVTVSRRLARQALDEQQSANIHDHKAMLRAAVHLDMALRRLVDSLDAQDGTS
ncbi:hypothetical protein [Streptomyces sp. CLCI03]